MNTSENSGTESGYNNKDSANTGFWNAPLPEELRKYGKEITVRAGRAFHYQDDPCASAFYILQGNIRPVKFASDGKAFDLRPLGRGQWFGLCELLCTLPALFDAVAIDECRTLSFNKNNLDRALRESSASRFILMALSEQIIRLHQFISDDDAQGKLLSYLLSRRFSGRDAPALHGPGLQKNKPNDLGVSGPPGTPREFERSCLKITQNLIAEALGLTRETVNRQLGDLEAMGLLMTGRGEIRIPDWEKISSFALERKN